AAAPYTLPLSLHDALPIFYLRAYYADEPLFADSKIITSVYAQGFEGELDPGMIDKIAFDGMDKETVSTLGKPDYNNLLKVAVDYSDAVILASEDVPEALGKHISGLSKPVLPYVTLQEAEEAYTNFYKTEVLK